MPLQTFCNFYSVHAVPWACIGMKITNGEFSVQVTLKVKRGPGRPPKSEQREGAPLPPWGQFEAQEQLERQAAEEAKKVLVH